MKKSLLASSLVHCLLFLPLLLSQGSGDQKSDSSKKFPNKSTGSEDVRIIPKVTQVEIVDTTSLGDGPKNVEKKASKKECPKSYYGGIGISMRYDGIVAEVVEGYPAHRANIEVGDTLSSDEEIVGTVGTQVNIKITKTDGTSLTKTLTREKICTEN